MSFPFFHLAIYVLVRECKVGLRIYIYLYAYELMIEQIPGFG